MSRARFRLRLPPDCTWQVCWYGTLSQLQYGSSAWGIHVYFRQFFGDSSEQTGSVFRRIVSLAHMHLLPIGRCVAGSNCELLDVHQLTHNSYRGTHLVDFSLPNTSSVPRSSIQAVGSAGAFLRTPEYDGMLLRVGATQSTPEVFIPCATLFQYFWGVSSRISRLVINDQLGQVDRFVRNPAGSGMDADGRCTLVLRQGMTDDDAPYLATILAEPHALEAGREIGLSLIQQLQTNAHGDPPRLDVRPPFARPLRLTGYYTRRVGDDGHAALFLSHIIESDLLPLWTSLDFSRDNDSNEGTNDDGNPKLPIDRPSFPLLEHPSDQEFVDIEDIPADGHVSEADLGLLPPDSTRFPELAMVPARRILKETTTHERQGHATHVRSLGAPYSALDGIGAPSTGVVSAELSRSFDVSFEADRTQDDVPDEDDTVHERLKNFADVFADLPRNFSHSGQQVELSVNFIDPYDAKMRRPHHLYFRAPAHLQGEPIAWLYKDPGSRLRKMGVCVELCVNAGTTTTPHFVLDFEPRRPRRIPGSQATQETRNGFLAVWFDEERGPDETLSALQRVIDAVAQRGNPKLKESPAPGVRTRAFRHSETPALQLLAKIFGATDQSEAATPPAPG